MYLPFDLISCTVPALFVSLLVVAVEIGEYLRIFPEPRRYPSFLGVNWESKVSEEGALALLRVDDSRR